MRRRKRKQQGTRRWFLAGGLLVAGGVSVLGGTKAFSQLDANRAISIFTDDENALLGLNTASSVEAGVDHQHIAELTNNTNDILDITVELKNSSQGNISPETTTLESGNSTSVSMSVAADSPSGTDALSFVVTANGQDGLHISLSRSIDVIAGPILKRNVRDRSGASTATYQVNYLVENLPEFEYIEVSFDNLENDWSSDSSTSDSMNDAISYSTDGGTFGDPYAITIEVYDESNDLLLNELIEDNADGSNPGGNDDLGRPDDPVLESFTLQDNTENNSTEFQLEYEVSNIDRLREVVVTFLNHDNDYATETVSNESAPIGSVTHTSGGTEGDTYDITVDVVTNNNNTIVNSGSITYVSGSSDSASWPEE